MTDSAAPTGGTPSAAAPDAAPATMPAPVPAANPPPNPKPRGCWHYLKRIFAAIYILFATIVSLFFVSFATEGGGPVSAYLPTDHIALLHIKSGEKIWRGLENDPRVLALLADEDLQTWTHWKDEWEKTQAKWRELPGFIRDAFPLSREGLSGIVGGEMAFAIQLPEKKGSPAPVIFFLRVNGGCGPVLRFARWLAYKLNRNAKREIHDLGGGLIAITGNGAKPEGHPEPADPVPFPDDAMAELVLRPEAVLKTMLVKQNTFPPAPPPSEIVCVEKPPKEICILLRTPGNESMTFEGAWLVDLPPVVEPAPLFDIGQNDDRKPIFEAEAPINMRAVFLRWLDKQMEVSENGSDKTRRQWENRLLELDKAGVDLNKDLWTAFGSRMKLAIVPPDEENGEKVAKLLVSFPFQATVESRHALAELARVRWDGLAEGRAQQPEDWKIYVRQFSDKSTQRFVLVKKNPPIPLWMLDGKSLAAISDAGPLAPMWGAPELQLEKKPASAADMKPRPIFYLRADGVRLAPQAAVYAQSYMEDLRDDDKKGVAAFMEKYPDEMLYVRLTDKITRFVGQVELEMRPAEGSEAKKKGIISGRWRPQMPTAPEAGN